MITLLVPTRGRPDNVRRLLLSVDATARGVVDLCLYVDDDDPSRAQTLELATASASYVVTGERVVLSEMWNRCWDEVRPELAMHCGDDIVMRTDGWDLRVREAFERFPDRIAFVHGDDGIQNGNIGTHGFLHRNWVETVGYFVPPYFSSDYNDLWLTEVADALGRRVYLPDVYTEHMHPVAGKAELDQTHRDRLARHERDDVARIYRDKADARRTDVALLRAFVDAWDEES